MSYRLRSARPALESAPPLSSIMSQPAEVFGMDRFADPVSFMLPVSFILRAVEGGMVFWL